MRCSQRLAFGTGPCESAIRYEEPNHYTNKLTSMDSGAGAKATTVSHPLATF